MKGIAILGKAAMSGLHDQKIRTPIAKGKREAESRDKPERVHAHGILVGARQIAPAVRHHLRQTSLHA
jgi:hypothetical protein